MPLVPPPRDINELLGRASALAGRTFSELALEFGIPVPGDLRRAKGWPGQLMERVLGADAQSRAVPDFEHLGIELKTLPVDRTGHPLETTFVCTIPVAAIGDVEWQASRVRRKLDRVLWVPIDGERRIPVGERRVGTALLWSPSAEEEDDLRFDWEELAGLIGRGEVESITGHLGKYLQVRPKARDSRARRRGVDSEGVSYAVLPRGFYLRTAFTARIIRRHFALPGERSPSASDRDGPNCNPV